MKYNRGFEVVDSEFRKTTGNVILPTRATAGSMAYDFYANDYYTVEPGEIVKVWTDVKAYMNLDEGLMLNIRSSMGGKFVLANVIGFVDGDYYSNESNDGNIGFFLKNVSDEYLTIQKGDRIGQGMFIKYLTVDNDTADGVRTGGFGSTN